MVLDREEEAKRQYEYANNPQNFQRQPQNQQFVGTAPAAQISEMPDMTDIPGPTNKRKMQAAA